MWKILLLAILLSVDAQKLKFNRKIFPEELDESLDVSKNLIEVEARADEFTYRLPNSTKPELCILDLNIGNFHQDVMTFTGNVFLEIRVLENTRTITLHSAVFATTSTLTTTANVPITHTRDYDATREFLIFHASQDLLKDSVVRLVINYQGTIRTTISGIYRGSYVEGNQRRFFAATHMQPTFFRRVSPGYDEPSFKSIYQLILRHNSIYTAISNTPVQESINAGQTTITYFKPTPLMSTYLFAFVIADFEVNEATNVNNILFRVFSSAAQIGNTHFGLETGMRALELYESAFETKYELEKLDQVALPVFNRGGMENYGIVFYREDYLLVEPSVTTAFDKEFAAATIVHEVCHKFFGNLLTPHWWSVLWISEGFCRFYEYYMTEKIYPTMRMEELFAVEAAQSILYRDSSPNTRPMTRYEDSPSGVASLFDGIAYSKSASVLRMFLYSLSEPTFHKGLKIYLSKSTSNPEGVAKPEHLYKALQQATDADNALPDNYLIEDLFGCWETQPGYPIVYVERSYNDYRVRFTQNRFTDNVADGTVWDSLWHIPITISSKVNLTVETRPKFWMNQREIEIKLEEVKPDSYLIVNTKQTGYYRVQYDDANWMLIAKELSHGNFSTIPPNSRAMVIDDAAVFFENKILHIRIFLELIKYLEHDIDYIPWLAATNNLGYIRRMLDDDGSNLSAAFKKFLRALLAKTYNNFGPEEVEGEPHYHKHIRNIAINWACQAHLETCINGTRDKFRELIVGNRVGFSSDHEASIFCNGNLRATKQEFDFMWRLFSNSVQSARRSFYLRSMGCIENEEILTKFMKMIIESNEIDNNNSEWFTIVQAVYSNGPIGLRVALKFMRIYYDDLIGLLTELNSMSSLNTIFRGIANRINNEELFKELTDLLVIYNINEATANDVKAISVENLTWIATYSGDIQDFLDSFFGNGSSASTFSCLVIVFGLAFNWIMQN